MTPVFANSATIMSAERLVLRGGGRSKLSIPVRYGILRHPDRGGILIDTGYGPAVTQAAGRSWIMRAYTRALGPRLQPEGAIDTALARLGMGVKDIAHVIVTHFHADHVSELHRFPNAQVWASAGALQAIRAGSAFASIRHGVFPELLPDDLECRLTDLGSLPQVAAPLGLGQGGDLFGDGSVLAIDLPGHADGHYGLCFPQLAQPLLYAVDVQWVLPAVLENRLPGFPASMVAADGAALKRSARRVAEFHGQGGAVLLCHDPAPSPFDMGTGDG